MNKTELITAVAQEAEMTKKDAEKAVKAVIDVVSGALAKGEKVQLIGFGTFEVRERKAREGHNPSTQEVIKIPASKTPAFRVSKQLKEKVNVKPAKKTRAKKAAKKAKVAEEAPVMSTPIEKTTLGDISALAALKEKLAKEGK